MLMASAGGEGCAVAAGMTVRECDRVSELRGSTS